MSEKGVEPAVIIELTLLVAVAMNAVFDYRKEVSLVALVSMGVLFLGFALNFLPHAVYLTVGVVSLVLAAISLYLLRKSSRKSCEIAKPM